MGWAQTSEMLLLSTSATPLRFSLPPRMRVRSNASSDRRVCQAYQQFRATLCQSEVVAHVFQDRIDVLNDRIRQWCLSVTDFQFYAELDSDLRILGNVELALYTGQFTHDELSGVDFLVVGDINPTQLNKFVAELEAKESKEIRYTSMSIDEYRYRLQVKDRFVANINQAKKQILIDKHGLLGQPAS